MITIGQGSRGRGQGRGATRGLGRRLSESVGTLGMGKGQSIGRGSRGGGQGVRKSIRGRGDCRGKGRVSRGSGRSRGSAAPKVPKGVGVLISSDGSTMTTIAGRIGGQRVFTDCMSSQLSQASTLHKQTQ